MATVVNNSLETDNFHNHQYLKLIINISTLLCTIFAIIISILIIIYICINLLQKNNLKKSTNISLLLICNTCLAIICSSISLTLMILSNIGGDMNIYILKRINHWACHIRGYLHFVFINSIYLSYMLQGSFRLLHIAFHKYWCLRKIYSFSSFIIVQWIASFLFILPILIEYENYSSFIVYLPQEFYCQVPITNIRGTTFLILSVYFVPLCCIEFSSIDCALFTCRVQQHHTTGKNSFYMVYSAEAKLSSDEQNTITYHVQQNNQLVQQCLDSNAIKMKIYYGHQLKDHIDEIQPND
ncbi:unnamed protein product [Rotaria sordida]|uniref:G-protein coupled receptors family 1 profile domain-containing protein n=1 Tax=Rotaria sordida TaxID=392033 RepID=A0A815I6V5_9BILA|nr:unnamed protein product [Rotaria sordida]CAF3700015.1 unnamed protein product [Rotaria sordida]